MRDLKFCQSAKRIIDVSLAAVVRDMFIHHSNDVRYCIARFLFVLRNTSFKLTAHAPVLWHCRRVVHYKTLVLIIQYPCGCWIQEGTRYTPRRTTTVKSENGLRKICFAKKIDLESRREGLLFLRSIIVEMFSGNVLR